ncbi:MAG TPA: hypothetical protein VFA68_17910 [Terriglobales bacterium]|nr:hypothetical protein [Terriglobales bacterium]
MTRIALIALLLLATLPAPAQQLAKRLIMKDGSYQLATKYEIQGDRVHYFSAERGEWEDVPKELIDWNATEQFEKDRASGKPAPEAVELDKELEAERKAEEAKTPLVAPGLRLPEDGVVLLDNYQSQSQLVVLEQNGGELNKNMKGNILRAAINPLASAKQTIELPGPHAKIISHAATPAIFVNVQAQEDNPNAAPAQLPEKPQKGAQPQAPWDRFRIVRAQTKGDKRIIGDVKIAVYGKVSQEGKVVPSNAEQLTGGWVKITPTQPLEPGEYAVAEMLGKDGMNLYVWDFTVNPKGPANGLSQKPDPSAVPTHDLPR